MGGAELPGSGGAWERAAEEREKGERDREREGKIKRKRKRKKKRKRIEKKREREKERKKREIAPAGFAGRSALRGTREKKRWEFVLVSGRRVAGNNFEESGSRTKGI